MITEEALTKAAAIYRDVAGYPIVPARHFDALRAACVEARNAALEEAAKLIIDNQIAHTSNGDVVEKRSDGNIHGLAYAKAIRALKDPT